MKRILGVALVASCGAAASPASTPPVRQAAPVAAERWIFRQLRVGTRQTAMRTTFELVIDGDRASLLESGEQDRRARLMAEADRNAQWTVVTQRMYRGTATVTPGALDLELASDGVQRLQLRCIPRSVDAAAPGALRVPSPGRAADGACGDHGTWDPPATSLVRALVCDSGGADPDDEDDDDRLVFAPPPGLEYAAVNDGCVLRGGGLRIAR